MENPDLSRLSTHSDEVQWLGRPGHSRYQECWQRFYQRYHQAILHYIIAKAGWSEKQMYQAEEVASRVYEKGYRWSFRRHKGVRFRIILKRLVKDVLSEYWRQQDDDRQVRFDEAEEFSIGQEDTISQRLSMKILQMAIADILAQYPPKHQRVLQWIWEKGEWPKAIELAELLPVKSADARLQKAAAQQWKKRNRHLWSDFQEKLRQKISELVWGEGESREMRYFENLSLE